MNIELLIQDSEGGTTYDFSNMASDIKYSTQIEDYAGKLEFTLIEDTDIFFEGSIVSLICEGNKIFFGNVFNRKRKQDGKIQVTAYDQLRYLQYNHFYKFSNMTCSDIFSKICADLGRPYKVINASSYILPLKFYDNKKYYEMFKDSSELTLVGSGRWYFIRDNFGVLEHIEIGTLNSDLVIGDKSLLTEYDYESSIDGESYNQVLLAKDNKDTAKRELYQVLDSSNIKKWGGVLQYFEVVDEKMNEAQIKARADMILKARNRVEKSLKLKCLGHFSVREGSGVYLSISALDNENINNRFAFVTACTHNFSNKLHTMDIEVKVM